MKGYMALSLQLDTARYQTSVGDWSSGGSWAAGRPVGAGHPLVLARMVV